MSDDDYRKFAGDLSRLSRELQTLANRFPPEDPRANCLGDVARAIHRKRRLRERWFPDAEFGEPYWDILLDLFASEMEGRAVSISSACIAAAVPATTALRWITKMVEQGVLERQGCSADDRVAHLRLSCGTRERMIGYLLANGSLPSDVRHS